MLRVTYINDYVTYYWYYVTWRKICVLFVFLHLFLDKFNISGYLLLS